MQFYEQDRQFYFLIYSLSNDEYHSNDDLLCSDNKRQLSLIQKRNITAEFPTNSLTNITEIIDLLIEQDPDNMQSCNARWDVLEMIYYNEEIIHQNKRKRRDC
ncbi:hypothetical protein T06_13757 [Trichinella sp. T6]|nr:hypothetical protein T06_13757 [Trichinella sp. T6]